MREIDDVEHPEDHGEPKAEQRVERAVDQSHQELRVESLHIDRSFETRSRLTPDGSPPAQGRRASTINSSPAHRHFPTAAGTPGRPGLCRSTCNSPTVPWIPRAS